ncbi:hypothetical protein NGM99_08215 [Mesorhizobium sp. RP14(2022)]|uniref:Uncharacterized protein n=1 Tax=Mesorhizobium liriopis TaxID=2953882 RepID=A0ABT1C704_9HYPH|nr:hypothetical protein [Mesorhizobium liriopis]MCO6049776.1 hypothetical protein [Mesorhizobium liriopis]
MTVPDSLFRFWAEAPAGSFRHPRDRFVLERVPHRFPHSAPPNPFFGPLRTAPVVLLYLSPGLDDFDEARGKDPAYETFFKHQWSGEAPLPSGDEYKPWFRWWSRRVAQFGVDPADAPERVAFLNISAYRSKSFHDWPMLAALPSSRASLDWAQDVLFPQAYEGARIVVCMRSAKYWGLSPRADGLPWGEGLYALPFTQSGFLHHGDARERVGAAIRAKLGIAA